MRTLVLLLALLAVAPAWAQAQAPAKARPGGGAEPRTVAPRGPLGADEMNNITVFRVGSPSTVHITTIESQRDLFTMNVTQVPRGTGSGFIWDEQGHIVTNFHVIQGASGARVTLADQSEWPADLTGYYPDRDLAVLKINAPRDKLKAIAIGTSRDLQVGQKVFAIGNPFGLDQTLTTGIISALNREIDSVNDRKIRGVIQTDAAINPGNSGGPLLDSAGRLIGVNTAIFSPSGASAGVGFAIPADEVNRVVPRLIRDGRFARPSIGIRTGPPEFQAALRLPKGVPVLGVVPGSPAAAAGIQPFRRKRGGDVIIGDIITAIDKKPVTTFDEVLDALEWHQPGDVISIGLIRNGKATELKVKLTATE
jgi:S1-C subfamily serine protease